MTRSSIEGRRCYTFDEIETFEYGKFVHILDPEKNKIELWEANNIGYDKICDVRTKLVLYIIFFLLDQKIYLR